MSFLSGENLSYLQYRLRQIYPESKWLDLQLSVRDLAINWYKSNPNLDNVYYRDGIEGLNQKFIEDMINQIDYNTMTVNQPVLNDMFQGQNDPNIEPYQAQPRAVDWPKRQVLNKNSADRLGLYYNPIDPATTVVPKVGLNLNPKSKSYPERKYSKSALKRFINGFPTSNIIQGFNARDTSVMIDFNQSGLITQNGTINKNMPNNEEFARNRMQWNNRFDTNYYNDYLQSGHPLTSSGKSMTSIADLTNIRAAGTNVSMTPEYNSYYVNARPPGAPLNPNDPISELIYPGHGLDSYLMKTEQSHTVPKSWNPASRYQPIPMEGKGLDSTHNTRREISDLRFGDVPILSELDSDQLSRVGHALYRNKDRPQKPVRAYYREMVSDYYPEPLTIRPKSKFVTPSFTDLPESRINTVIGKGGTSEGTGMYQAPDLTRSRLAECSQVLPKKKWVYQQRDFVPSRYEMSNHVMH